MNYSVLLLICFTLPIASIAKLTLAQNGKAQATIVTQLNATATEVKAAEELSRTLQQITGAAFAVVTNEQNLSKETIIVGQGDIAKKFFPEVPFDKLGRDEIVMQVKGGKLLLAGGRPRGTIYAVNRFLQEQCGVRWWTPWATNIPHQANLKVPALNVRYAPPFEYRAPFWFAAFEQKWKVHNQSNDQSWLIPEDLGGSIKYKGFAHTFNNLVPPDKHFKEHPEWFSLVKGKRIPDGQLCLTDPQLRDFVVNRVKHLLNESRDSQIVSVTQNDWFKFCECPKCKAVDDAEESHAGTMISFVNYIAEKIEPEFPNVLVDTFAYQYTRKPPKTVKPRHNVTVRLCSIECNFREPLDHPSNAAFAEDIRKWSAICSHLYIWDYVTEFKNYVHPHPNWFVLGPNIRFFERNGVKGIFEEGAYAGHGAEMAEMRAWVLAQLMWNPKQDDRALIREFLNGYYGMDAGKLIYRYLELVHKSSEGLFLGCYLRKEPPIHLQFSVLGEAERLWQQTETATASDPEKLMRVRIAHLPVRYAFIKYWNWLRHDCWERNMVWPLPESRKAVADEFRTVCKGIEGKDWTHVRALSEHGLNVDDFLKEHGDDSAHVVNPPPPVRIKNPPPPSDLKGIKASEAIDLQDNTANLAGFGKWAKILSDDDASDKRAVWMPGNHNEWAFRINGSSLPKKAWSGKWDVYAIIRVEKKERSSAEEIAFSTGVYDNKSKSYPASLKQPFADANSSYKSYFIGQVEFNADRDIFISPANNPGVKSLWIDRVYLVRNH